MRVTYLIRQSSLPEPYTREGPSVLFSFVLFAINAFLFRFRLSYTTTTSKHTFKQSILYHSRQNLKQIFSMTVSPINEYGSRVNDLNSLVSDLRNIGAQTLLEIPQIAVIGNQSAGKP